MLTFSTVGAAQAWELTDDQIAAWQALYPNLDVAQQCRMAWGWVDANPTKRKTAKGMPRFLVAWLNRAVGRGDVKPTAPKVHTYTGWHCNHVDRCAHRSQCRDMTVLGRPERQAS